MARIYIPATFDTLKQLDDVGHAGMPGGWAFMVTPALTEFYLNSDEEEIAHVAFQDAARASIRMLADGARYFPHRRVVISADVDDQSISYHPDNGESVVCRDPQRIDFDDIAAIHVDIAASEADTAAAIEVVDAADLDDEDAELIVGDALDNFLAWYDPLELGLLTVLADEANEAGNEAGSSAE